MTLLLQDEGWKPSITVKQILLGIQVGFAGQQLLVRAAHHPEMQRDPGFAVVGVLTSC